MKTPLVIAALFACNLLVAQTPAPSAARVKAQEAYRAWRLVDPNLEADAANHSASIASRSASVAAEAAKYFSARQAYLDALHDELEHAAGQFTEAQPGTVAAAIDPATAAATSSQLTASTNYVANNLAAVSDSTDPGLRELRKALEREKAALAALTEATKKSRSEEATLGEAGQAAAQARKQVAARYKDLSSGVANESDASQKIGAAWANYYRSLAAQANENPPVQVTLQPAAPVVAAPGDPAAKTPALEPALVARVKEPAVAAEAPKVSAPVAQTPAIAPPAETVKEAIKAPPAPKPVAEAPAQAAEHSAAVAIRSTAPGIPFASRYAGDWMYPTVNEHYHGAHPESTDLTVRDDAGQMRGSLRVKFRLPPSSTIDPVVEFTFSGPYQSAKTQSFPITLADGTKGTFEMIPATTFNLLEISFTLDERPGKINSGNFFIIRK